MKKLLICMLALCFLAGCGGQATPERPPLAEPPVQEGNDVPVQPVAPPVPQEPTETPADEQQPAPPPPGADEQPPIEVAPPVVEQPDQPVQPVEPQPVAPDPVPPQEQEVTRTELTCSLEIRCDKLIGNGDLDPDKVELVPADGLLFAVTDAVFYEGESVFNLLQRTMKQNKQHLEFEQTPLYNSAFIEGICNLYAFDAGALSGWMYSVNGVFPNYGCSQYVLQAGDVIVWHYTCDLGADLGAGDIGGNNG